MHLFGALAKDAVIKAVAPTATELDRFEPARASSMFVHLENRDGTQTCNAWIESRPKAGAGNWSVSSLTVLDAIVAGEVRGEPITITGAGEVRIMATASGAGLTVWLSRRNVSGE